MFNTEFNVYGTFILLAFLVNIIIVMLIYNRNKFTRDEIIGALVYELLGIIIGAKLLTYIQNYNQVKEFDIFNIGLSSYGGVIGGIICLIIFGWQFKKSIKDMLFTFFPPVPLMYAIGKIGCFLAGCCYGIEYTGIGNVVYNFSSEAPNGIYLFPIQIVETFCFLLIFIYVFLKIKKNTFSWKIFGISFILCGSTKFLLDFFRMSHIGIILSLNQIISIVFVILGFVIFYFNRKNE